MKEILTKNNDRLLLLEECEKKIGNYFRRGLEATVGIGQQLRKINDLELYLERGCRSINEYAFDAHGIDPRNVARFIGISQSAELFKSKGIDLPANETQLVELGRLEPEQQIQTWEVARKAAEEREENVTAAILRQAVENAKRALPPPATSPKAASRKSLDEPDLDLGSLTQPEEQNGSKGRIEVPRISLSEDGEEALEKIRRTCGDIVANAIENYTLQISERELRLWADQQDPDLLTHYIMHKGWSVSKAIGFENQTITENTKLSSLVLLAQANGGHYEADMEAFTVAVDMVNSDA